MRNNARHTFVIIFLGLAIAALLTEGADLAFFAYLIIANIYIASIKGKD